MYEYIRRTRSQDMTTPTNPSGFDFTNTQVYGLPELFLKQTVIQNKIGEFRSVTLILAVKVWTQDDVELETTPGQDTRLGIVREATIRYYLLGTDGFSRHDHNIVNRHGKMESPFWACAEGAKSVLISCLSVHLGMYAAHPTSAMLVNDDTSLWFEVPNVLDASVEGQVAIVFPLVSLMYVTLNIPVPQRGVTLWSMMTYPTEGFNHVFRGAKPRVEVPTFECLDLENDAEWCTRECARTCSAWSNVFLLFVHLLNIKRPSIAPASRRGELQPQPSPESSLFDV